MTTTVDTLLFHFEFLCLKYPTNDKYLFVAFRLDGLNFRCKSAADSWNQATKWLKLTQLNTKLYSR